MQCVTPEQKQEALRALFSACCNDEERFAVLIDLGKSQPGLDPRWKHPSLLVQGCQSEMYLRSFSEEGRMFFLTESNALLSAGLALLLTRVYSGEPPSYVLMTPPDYLKEFGFLSRLSPSRSNGLYHIHLKMRQDALRLLTAEQAE